MRNDNSAATAAGTPGSPGFRPVQPGSVFKRLVKPVLRSGVVMICAGSIAMQTVTVSSYGQTIPGPNTTRDNQTDGSFDAPLQPREC